ncbi:protein of unknown function [Burkholderia multivorans]
MTVHGHAPVANREVPVCLGDPVDAMWTAVGIFFGTVNQVIQPGDPPATDCVGFGAGDDPATVRGRVADHDDFP